MRLLITGTPATGKTSIAYELSKILKLPYIDVKEVIKSHPETVDRVEDNELIINEKLRLVLQKELPLDCIFETHLIEYCPKPGLTVILRTKPAILKKRMLERKYSLQKIRDNVEVELLDYFTQMVKSNKVIEYDSSFGTAKDNAKKIRELIEKKRYNKGKISYSAKEIRQALV